MKIKDILRGEGIHISFEVFPPKTEDSYDAVLEAAGEIASLQPVFMSVTYGAGGGTSRNTVRIATRIEEDFQVPSLAHLTCVSSTREEVRQVIASLRERGIENILALRGDIPEDVTFPLPHHYRYASELIEDIRREGDFCIGAACYPEGHVEAATQKEDILHLKHKVDCGVDFLTTQMFFDNSILYSFLYRIREAGITVPVLPGIMPVTNAKQMKRICALSGTVLPQRFRAILDRFGDHPAAMEQAGIAYAVDQIIDLIANGIQDIHIYSMNRPRTARAIMDGLSEVIKA